MKYDKLVRDNIPEIVKQKGGNPVTHIAGDEEYRQKLNEKLQEEVAEFLESGEEEELADIAEVIRAIAATRGMTPEDLEALREKKTAERGAFKKKIILEES